MVIELNDKNRKIFNLLVTFIYGFEYSANYTTEYTAQYISFDKDLDVRCIATQHNKDSIHASKLINKYFNKDAEVFKKFLLALFDEEVQFDNIRFGVIHSLQELNLYVFSWTEVENKYGYDFSLFNLLLSQADG